MPVHERVDVEFYRGSGGVTWNREANLANTRQDGCGHVRRERVAGSRRVYSVNDVGAIAAGVHRHCPFNTGRYDGVADFAIARRHRDGRWEITRVLSDSPRRTR